MSRSNDVEGRGSRNQPQPTDIVSWWHRNWKWAVPLAGAAYLAMIIAFVGALALGIFAWVRSSSIAQEALTRARHHPEVTRALGEPIETGWWIMGNINVEGSSGEARLTIPVRGPRGSGTLYLEAQKSAGSWSFTSLEVIQKESQIRVDLLP